MLNLTRPRRAFGVIGAMIASPALHAGCGGDTGESGTGAPVAVAGGAEALQRQFVDVVGVPTLTALDPQVGDTQAAGIGFAIPGRTVRSVADRLIGLAP